MGTGSINRGAFLMRREFHPILLRLMIEDERIHVVLPDLGYRMYDDIIRVFPKRVHNVCAAEQLAVGAAVGMTYEGLIPIVYSITPFVLWRAAEWLRTYLNHEGAPVKLLGAGRGDDYRAGFSHDGSDDKAFLSILHNIVGYWPEDTTNLEGVTREWLYNERPSYLNLKR